ncbi:MAG: glycerophosphodiester phosphodiesterase family protein [Eubacteriales bacterium]|nr:glycerophosphodiester phosphodiesterase family protein [Eubacteriales bacterium]
MRELSGKLFSNLRSFLKETLRLLRHNLKSTIFFSLWCGVLFLYILDLTKRFCYSILTRTQGVAYIDKTNLTVLLKPVPFLLLTFYLIVLTYCALFEIGGLLHAFSMAQVGRDTDPLNMMHEGLKTVRKTLHPRNWPILFFVLVLYPFTNIICLTNSYKLAIPPFVLQAISVSRSYSRMFRGFFVLMMIAELVFFFSINIYILQKKSFFQSCAGSFMLCRRYFVSTVFCLAILGLFLRVSINSISSAVVANILDFASFVRQKKEPFAAGTGIFETSIGAMRHILIAALAPAVNNAGCTTMFFRYLEEQNKLNTLEPSVFRTITGRKRKWASVLVSLSAVLIAVFSHYLIADTGYLMEEVKPPIVCAHRGDNVHAPENTYPAFELCMAENLPWVEVDIQQARDGTIVCSHDVSLSRVCGVNIPISRLSYEELREYKMGDWMPGNYEDVTIPTLEEILLLAKENNVKVQVDIKGTGREKDYEEGILKAINDTGMHDEVMVISISGERIKRIKELDPTIVTAHAVIKAWSNYAQVEDADNLSLELGGVSPDIVHAIQESGMKVFCWTADDAKDIQYLVSCGVDVIGTDNPIMVLDELKRADYSGGFRRIFHIVMYMLQRMEK